MQARYRSPRTIEKERQANTVVALLAEILRGVPRLDGAACVSAPTVFDLDGGDPTLAAAVCSSCPARSDCSAWASALPPGDVTGTVAGEIHRHRHHFYRRNQRKAASA